jgi:hypothetical protein
MSPSTTKIYYTIALTLPAGHVQPSLEEISIEMIAAAKRLGLVYNGIQIEDAWE